jgi:transcriptional regulator with XRE-family HTH domain
MQQEKAHMETIIHPHVLKGLMARQNLTQQALADKSRIGIATIKRICSRKGMPKGQRRHTLAELSKALGVEEAALTATDLPPSKEDEHLKSLVQLKEPINRQTDLSFQAVEAMYGISRSAQIAMAPLFTALIAEASLKWRQDRLETLGTIADRLDAIRADNPLLTGAFARAWEAEKIEKQSIENKDVLGHRALKRLEEEFELASSEFDSQYNYDLDAKLPYEWISPFLVFLKDYAGSFAQPDIKIELGDEEGNPRMLNGAAEYRIGEAFIDAICSESSWARIAIEYGHVAINEIPPDLLEEGKAKERLVLLKSRLSEDDRKRHARRELEALSEYRVWTGEGEPLEVNDASIQRWIDYMDKGDEQ